MPTSEFVEEYSANQISIWAIETAQKLVSRSGAIDATRLEAACRMKLREQTGEADNALLGALAKETRREVEAQRQLYNAAHDSAATLRALIHRNRVSTAALIACDEITLEKLSSPREIRDIAIECMQNMGLHNVRSNVIAVTGAIQDILKSKVRKPANGDSLPAPPPHPDVTPSKSSLFIGSTDPMPEKTKKIPVNGSPSPLNLRAALAEAESIPAAAAPTPIAPDPLSARPPQEKKETVKQADFPDEEPRVAVALTQALKKLVNGSSTITRMSVSQTLSWLLKSNGIVEPEQVAYCKNRLVEELAKVNITVVAGSRMSREQPAPVRHTSDDADDTNGQVPYDYDDEGEAPEDEKMEWNSDEEAIAQMNIDPLKPSKYVPGTEGKVLVLSARYAAGVPFWHESDAGPGLTEDALRGRVEKTTQKQRDTAISFVDEIRKWEAHDDTMRALEAREGLAAADGAVSK